MTPQAYHGTRRYHLKSKGLSVVVGPLPHRQSIALYLEDAGHITPLAYFRNDEAANLGRDLLDMIASATLEEVEDDE